MNERASDTSPSQPDWSRRGAQILAIVAVLVLLFVGWNIGQPSAVPQRDDAAGIEATGFPQGETPEPYYYDEENNRWWHEAAPGQGHWHPGTPPPEDERE